MYVHYNYYLNILVKRKCNVYITVFTAWVFTCLSSLTLWNWETSLLCLLIFNLELLVDGWQHLASTTYFLGARNKRIVLENISVATPLHNVETSFLFRLYYRYLLECALKDLLLYWGVLEFWLSTYFERRIVNFLAIIPTNNIEQ